MAADAKAVAASRQRGNVIVQDVAELLGQEDEVDGEVAADGGRPGSQRVEQRAQHGRHLAVDDVAVRSRRYPEQTHRHPLAEVCTQEEDKEEEVRMRRWADRVAKEIK